MIVFIELFSGEEATHFRFFWLPRDGRRLQEETWRKWKLFFFLFWRNSQDNSSGGGLFLAEKSFQKKLEHEIENTL